MSGTYYPFRLHNNPFSMDVVFPALIGFFMVGLALSLLLGISLNINWNLFCPAIIIHVGKGMIFSTSNRV